MDLPVSNNHAEYRLPGIVVSNRHCACARARAWFHRRAAGRAGTLRD